MSAALEQTLLSKPVEVYLYREFLIKLNNIIDTLSYSSYCDVDDDECIACFKQSVYDFKNIYEDYSIDKVYWFDASGCEEMWQEFRYEHGWSSDELDEIVDDFRYGRVSIDPDVEDGYNYCSKRVGSFITGLEDTPYYIAWPYYFGGGKHGRPSEVDWVNEAYIVKATEEVKTITTIVYVPVTNDSTT